MMIKWLVQDGPTQLQWPIDLAVAKIETWKKEVSDPRSHCQLVAKTGLESILLNPVPGFQHKRRIIQGPLTIGFHLLLDLQ